MQCAKITPSLPGHYHCVWRTSELRICERTKIANGLPVDSLTQAILGASVGEVVLGRRLGNWSMAWGAAFGTLPDLDVLFTPFFDHAGWLWWHRGPSHSILVMIMASLFMARPLSKLWNKAKVSPTLAGWFVFLVWSTHVLIDCFTTYGTLIYWPFDGARVAFNNLFIIDPLFTLPIMICLIWAAFMRKAKQLSKRRRLNAIGLGLACLYVGLSFGAKAIISREIEADLTRQGVEYSDRFESPTAFNIILWRAVVNEEEHIRVGYRSLFDGSSRPMRWTLYPKGREAAASLGRSRELDLVRHFSGDWWIARSHAKGIWIGDTRFGEMRDWGNRKGMVDHRFVFSWDLLSAEGRNRLRPTPRQGRGDVSELMKRLSRRAMGDRESWEANPRLEGVTGSLPEFLMTSP